MAGRRVLVSGMGSELGSLVATLLEQQRWVGEIRGLDNDPPRRRLRRAAFYRVEPSDRRRMAHLVKEFDPHVVVHVAVWEPNARAAPRDAARWTSTAAVGVLGAAAECPSLEHITVRSCTAVYGRRRNAPTRPDEATPPDPTSAFGRSLIELEDIASASAAAADVSLTTLRLAPVIGPHVPSPLGRLLRLPVVPVSLIADPAFSVVDDRDAAAATIAAAAGRYHGPVNVVSPGAVTATQAARIGRRIPIPLIGPQWRFAGLVTSALGAPIPEHIHELLQRGRTADGSSAAGLLGVAPIRATREIIEALYEWATVIHIRPAEPRGGVAAERAGSRS